MQVTGNSANDRKKELSIRFVPGGLSFSVSNNGTSSRERSFRIARVASDTTFSSFVERAVGSRKELQEDFDRVTFWVDTPCAIIPSDLVDAERALGYMRESGLCPKVTERCVISDSEQGVACLFAVDNEVVDAMSDRYGDRLVWRSPIQEAIARKVCGVMAHFTSSMLFLVVRDGEGRLSAAECFPCTNAADAVYYLSKIRNEANEGGLPIILSGFPASGYRKVLKRYFRNIILCEL